MFKVTLSDRPEFLAGDHTRLREIFHPAKHALKLGYSLAHGILGPGQRSKWHALASSEVYYFIAGQGRFLIDDQAVQVERELPCMCRREGSSRWRIRGRRTLNFSVSSIRHGNSKTNRCWNKQEGVMEWQAARSPSCSRTAHARLKRAVFGAWAQ